MGAMQSFKNVTGTVFSESPQHSRQPENIVECSIEEDFESGPIPEDILIECLSYVPPEDLIFNCRLVCKQWRAEIDAQSVWALKCEREHIKLPTRKFIELPKHHYRYIYWHTRKKPKNLLKNPCGENKFQDWKIVNFTGDEKFAIENPPVGADPVPAVVGSQSCFATTYSKCEKYQVVSLTDPVNRYLLEHDLVNIRVGEWYAARFDCASEYALKIMLYDHNYDVIDTFDFKYIEEQWTGKEWHLVTHEFNDVTKVCFVGFYHQGKDRQFWAGHYGSKMTGAFVELCVK